MAARSYGQYSGLTRAVELIGERWALLIVRDLLVGPRRYTDLKQGMPRIPTNILSTRLKDLQDGGLVRRVPLKSCGLVYELTEYGRRLEPLVLGLERWGSESLAEPGPGDLVSPDALTILLRSSFRPDLSEQLPSIDVELRVAGVALRVQANGPELRIAQLAPLAPPVGGRLPAGEPDLVLTVDAGDLQWLVGSGHRSARHPADRSEDPRGEPRGSLHVVAGDPKLLARFVERFRVSDPAPIPAR